MNVKLLPMQVKVEIVNSSSSEDKAPPKKNTEPEVDPMPASKPKKSPGGDVADEFDVPIDGLGNVSVNKSGSQNFDGPADQPGFANNILVIPVEEEESSAAGKLLSNASLKSSKFQTECCIPLLIEASVGGDLN